MGIGLFMNYAFEALSGYTDTLTDNIYTKNYFAPLEGFASGWHHNYIINGFENLFYLPN